MNIGFLFQFARAVCKRSRRGLFGGKTVMFGNNVSESGRRTRRIFRPNVQRKSFWSDVLNRKLVFNVTTYALRCIDKAGGLDKYLLNTSDKKLASDLAVQFKRKMRKLLKQQAEGPASGASATVAPPPAA